MSGIKVKVSVEPGDAIADLKATLQPGDGPAEDRVIAVGGAHKEAVEEYELELGSTLTIVVEKLQRMEYDASQMMNVVKDVEPPAKSGPKSKGAHESGAKESSHEKEEAHPNRRTTYR